MEAAGSSETLVTIYQCKGCPNSENPEYKSSLPMKRQTSEMFSLLLPKEKEIEAQNIFMLI
jgi:hypothetical protein